MNSFTIMFGRKRQCVSRPLQKSNKMVLRTDLFYFLELSILYSTITNKQNLSWHILNSTNNLKTSLIIPMYGKLLITPHLDPRIGLSKMETKISVLSAAIFKKKITYPFNLLDMLFMKHLCLQLP